MSKQRNWRRLSRSFIPAIVLGLFVMGIGVAAAENASAQAATVNIEMGDKFFNPTQMTVNVGDTVVWTNKGQLPHDVTSDDGSILSPRRMAAGQTFSFTATKAGTFAYQCTIHSGMVATLIVQAATPTAAPNTGGGGMASTALGQWQQLAILGVILVGSSAALVVVRRRHGA